MKNKTLLSAAIAAALCGSTYAGVITTAITSDTTLQSNAEYLVEESVVKGNSSANLIDVNLNGFNSSF